MEEGLRVLVVDEAEERRGLYERVLSEQGYDVVVVGDGKKAVQEVRRQRFNLAFIEVEMPRMVGLLTSMALKEIRPDLEVVMMAGYGIEEQLRQALRAGIRDCLAQPVEALEIISNLGIQESNSYTITEESEKEGIESIRPFLQTPPLNVLEPSLKV